MGARVCRAHVQEWKAAMAGIGHQARGRSSRVSRRGYLGLALLLLVTPLRADESSLSAEEAGKLLLELKELRQDVLDRDTVIDGMRKRIQTLQVATNCA